MANGWGGARANAGRKSRADKHKGPIAEAERRIADRLPKLIDNMFTLADGVLVEKADAEGAVDVFRTLPCRMANQYLIDRILGRPTQALEVSGPDGDPVPVDLAALSTERLHELRGIVRELANQRPRSGPA